MGFWTSLVDAVENVAVPAIGFAVGGIGGAAAAQGLLGGTEAKSAQNTTLESALNVAAPVAGLYELGSNLASSGSIFSSGASSDTTGTFGIQSDDWHNADGTLKAGTIAGTANTLGSSTPGITSSLASLGSAATSSATTSPFGWGSPMNLLQMGGAGMNLYNSVQMRGLAQSELAAANAQRNAVPMPTPGSVTSTPGYQAGMDAVTRSMISQGYQGSGNMMAALQGYGQTAYQNAMQNYQTQQGIANQTTAAGAGLYSSGANMLNQGILGATFGTALTSNPNLLMSNMGKATGQSQGLTV